LQKDPELASHSFLYHALGTAQYKLGNYQSAVEWFDKAIAVKRFAGRTYFRRGKSLAQIGRTDEAEKDLAKAQELGYDGSNE
jgi:Flp pilus assembly protein TadD